MASLPFKNDGSFLEQFKKMQQQKEASGSGAAAETPAAAAAPDDTAAPASDAAAAGAAAPPPPPPAAAEAEAATAAAAAPAAEPPEFEASASFQGARQCCVFKLGPSGLGYYADSRSAGLWPKERPRPQRVDPSKPVILRSNKPIVAVRRPNSAAASNSSGGSGGGGPAAKRAKKDDADSNKPHYLKELERYQQQTCSEDAAGNRPLVK